MGPNGLIVLLLGRKLLEDFDVEGTAPKARCYWERGLCFCLLLAETDGIPYCTVKLILNATGKEGCLPA
jgi:hypothetical protein